MANIATRDAYGNTLAKLGDINENIVVLDADLSKSTKTNTFKEKFPQRFFNMGIAEQNMAGVAAGMAITGLIPFYSSFAVFATGRSFEVIRNSICYPMLNVKIAATHGGITVGEDGGSHESIEDIAIMRVLPNMIVMVPADAKETEEIVMAAAEINAPCYIRMGRSGVPAIYSDDYEFEIGKGSVVRHGNDVTIIACGIMVDMALRAADKLAEDGISAAVINMASIKPIDSEMIVKYANLTGAIVTAEEHSIIGGLGSAVAEVLAEQCPCKMRRVGVNDVFGESGKPAELLVKFGLTPENIVAKAKEIL